MEIAFVGRHEDKRKKKKVRKDTPDTLRGWKKKRVRKMFSWDLGQDEFKTGQELVFCENNNLIEIISTHASSSRNNFIPKSV